MVFVAITIPLMVHTAQLLLVITDIAPRWLAYLYAATFAVGFDLAVFMFSLYGLQQAKRTFAVMAGVVGFFFFNLEILFERLPADSWANGRLWASVVLGTMFAVVGAYLVYHSTELINQVFTDQTVSDPAATRRPDRRRVHAGPPGGGPKEIPARRTAKYKHTPRPPTAAAAAVSNGNSQDEKILLLRQEGKSHVEIGRQLGISDRTVRRKLKTLES